MLEQKHNKRAAISRASCKGSPRRRGRSPRRTFQSPPRRTPAAPRRPAAPRPCRADPPAHDPRRQAGHRVQPTQQRHEADTPQWTRGWRRRTAGSEETPGYRRPGPNPRPQARMQRVPATGPPRFPARVCLGGEGGCLTVCGGCQPRPEEFYRVCSRTATAGAGPSGTLASRPLPAERRGRRASASLRAQCHSGRQGRHEQSPSS